MVGAAVVVVLVLEGADMTAVEDGEETMIAATANDQSTLAVHVAVERAIMIIDTAMEEIRTLIPGVIPADEAEQAATVGGAADASMMVVEEGAAGGTTKVEGAEGVTRTRASWSLVNLKWSEPQVVLWSIILMINRRQRAS